MGGYVPAYPPEHSDRFQWRTTFPCKVTRDPKCVHANTTSLDVQDAWDEKMQNYGGTACCDCGKILVCGQIDPVTGEPQSPLSKSNSV